MKINVQAEGKILSITLTSDDTSTTWGGVCKKAVEEHLTKVYPDLLLQRLLQLSPTERLSHYLFRYGDGCATIFCLEWSSASVPGCVRLPLATGHVEVNVVLNPREGSMLESVETDPHLAVQNANGSLGPHPKDDVDVDLIISVVSSAAQTPNTYSAASTSVINIREHSSFPGCVDTIKMLPENEVNSVLSENSLLSTDDATATANLTTVSAGTSNKSKSKSPKKDKKDKKMKKKMKKKKDKKKKEDTVSKPGADAKKQPAAKSEDGESTAAAMKSSTKKSPPNVSSATVTRSPPPKKSGEAMIQLYLAATGGEEKSDSASSKSGEKKKNPSKKKSDTTESSTGKKDKSSSKKEEKIKSGDGTARTEDDPNVKRYIHNRQEEVISVKQPDVIKILDKKLLGFVKQPLERLMSVTLRSVKAANRLIGDSANLGTDAVIKAQEEYIQRTGDHRMYHTFQALRCLVDVRTGLKNHGIQYALQDIARKEMEAKGPLRSIFRSEEFRAIKDEMQVAAKQSAAVAKKKTSKSKESNAVADVDKASKKKRKAPSDGESSDTVKSPSKKKKAKTEQKSHTKLEKEEPKKVEVTAHVTKRPREYKGKYKDMPALEGPAKGMPDGWKEMHIPHASKPGYSYTVWYSPDGRRFDTKKGALSYIGFFEQTKDELKAFELFQKEQRVKKTSKICKSEGCLKLAQKGGKCIQHGGVVKKCSSAGCTNNAKRRGLCKRHGAYRDETVLTC